MKPFSVTKSILEINHFTTVDTAVFQCYNDYKDYSCQGQIVGLEDLKLGFTSVTLVHEAAVDINVGLKQ